MQGFRALWVCVALALCASGCGMPHPRAPEEVKKQAEERKEPEFFDDLDLTPAQRKRVLAIIDKLYADFDEYDRVRLVLLEATITQIRAGELNRDELLPLAEEAIKEFNRALPDGIDAMQNLHAALTRPQREKLVALFTEGRELSDEERREARNERVSKVLGLTGGQKASIYPALLALYVKHWGTISRFRSALHEAEDEFIEDDLVAHKLAIAAELDLMALGEVIFDALEIGMRNLTREQHETLAAILDAELRSPNPTHANDAPPVSKIPPTDEPPAKAPPSAESPLAEDAPVDDPPKGDASTDPFKTPG